MVRLFRIFIPIGTIILLLSDMLLVIGAFVLAAFISMPDPVTYLLYGNGVVNIGVVFISILIGLYFSDLYSDIYVKSHLFLMQRICFVMGAAFLLQGLISYVNGNLRMPLHVMCPGAVIAVAAIYGWRVFFSSYAVNAIGGDRMLLVGSSPILSEIADYLHQHPETGLSVIGGVSDETDQDELGRIKYLGGLDRLCEVVAATKPSRIVVGLRERRNRLPVAELLDLRYRGNLIEEAPTAFERVCGRVSMKDLRPSQLIYSGEFGPPPRKVLYHDINNIVLATIGIILSSPLMLLTALAVRLSSRGPILYRQVRVGMEGVPFTVYKFRSMRVDAEAGTGAVWATRNDPRVTGVGRIIRKIRFDELPQLWNVVRGEMSLVGPRPERPEFVKVLSEKIPYYRQRHAVRPGITGWAQINYKYGETLEDSIAKLEYDLYYIKHMSWSLDMYIVFHTLKAMVLSRGAQ